MWQNLLTAALGEIASTPSQLDDLFVRHTYLSAVIGMVVKHMPYHRAPARHKAQDQFHLN